MPEAGSQASASVCTPQPHAGATAEDVSAEGFISKAPGAESSGRATAFTLACTPEYGPGAGSEHQQGPSIETPVPANAASDAEGHAAAPVKTALRGPSPQLPGQSDLITPPPQVLDEANTPDIDASHHHLKKNTPGEALEGSTDQEVKSPPL